MKKSRLLLVGIVLISLSVAQADQTLVDLVKKVKPCVVLVQTFDKDNKPIGQGSGFFIDNKGRLITNHHVIEGAYSATIKTSAGKEYPVQGIVAKDTEADIVKLVVNIPDANNISFLNLSVNVPSEGEDIVVIGNPLGLESTVSTGIVSAVRDIPAFGKIIQITAPISPGSSGSPVINSKGEVIGIAILIATKGQNLNFAIPSDKILALKQTAKIVLLKEYNAVTTDPNDAQLFYDKGMKELWQENWSAALTYFQKEKEKNPQNADVWFRLGYCYDKLDRYQEAMEPYKQAIKIKPNFVVAYVSLGFAYSKLGRHQDAIEVYKQVIRIKPDYAVAHFLLGTAYRQLGRHQDAIEAYKQAIRIEPDDAGAHFGLGLAYLELDRYQDAIEAYTLALRIKPDDANAHCSLGVAYGELGRYQDAIEAYKQALRIEPDDVNAHFSLGVAYGELGRYQEEIESCKQAIRIKPDYAVAHYLLGWAYLRTGAKGSALEEYKILKTLDAELANELFSLIYK
jgi:tetratricopeptide (TPR) repeat protein